MSFYQLPLFVWLSNRFLIGMSINSFPYMYGCLPTALNIWLSTHYLEWMSLYLMPHLCVSFQRMNLCLDFLYLLHLFTFRVLLFLISYFVISNCLNSKLVRQFILLLLIAFSIRSSLFILSLQCDRIGQFLKVLGDKVSYKKAQMNGNYLGYFV